MHRIIYILIPQLCINIFICVVHTPKQFFYETNFLMISGNTFQIILFPKNYLTPSMFHETNLSFPLGVPLVFESFSWQHGVMVGACVKSESTAAAEHTGTHHK